MLYIISVDLGCFDVQRGSEERDFQGNLSGSRILDSRRPILILKNFWKRPCLRVILDLVFIVGN